MKAEQEVKTESTSTQNSKYSDSSNEIEKNNEDLNALTNLYPSITYPSLQNDSAEDSSKNISRSKLILRQIIQLDFKNSKKEQQTNQKQREEDTDFTSQEPNLIIFKGRLWSIDKQMEEYARNNLYLKQQSTDSSQPQQNNFKNLSKDFSKIAQEKVTFPSQGAIDKSSQYRKEKLLQEIKVLSEAINEAMDHTKSKEKAWLNTQKTLNQKLQRKEKQISHSLYQIAQLEAQNNILKSQKEMMKKKEEKELFEQKMRQKTVSEEIKVLQGDKRQIPIDSPILRNEKQTISNIQHNRPKQVVFSLQKIKVQAFKLLNKLRKQLNQTQRKKLRFKIAQLL